jgi:hypothetical protein
MAATDLVAVDVTECGVMAAMVTGIKEVIMVKVRTQEE